ncbi:glycosyltransferase [Pelagibacteraceae bacterium]|nr:glycosyltransferase [Pelagibacteraceae bacterium]
MSYLKTSVVITTFKSEHIIDRCIQSIPLDVSIIIIENSNNINFKLDIESKYSNVKCTLAGSNIGYSRANNLGLSQVKTEYALVLNPDAKLKKNTLDIFFEEAKKNKDFWLIGPINNQGKFYEKNNHKIFEVKNLKGFAIFF